MNRASFGAAFLLGAVAVVWMAAGFVGSDLLALSVTVVIGAVYILGFVELYQFRQATVTLDSALANIPAGLSSLDEWLLRLHVSLQNAVRLRIEGERVALPGPVFTPYLVGLLVMLGLLGTFVGMVVTLKGAVLALESTTELHAIREGLAAPIKGLGLAFGTSVAGVAASAMLGLMSTLSRRERLFATSVLDSRIASTLRPFSLVHNRQETYKALQYQAQALPDLVAKLQVMSDSMERMGFRLGDTLTSQQQAFQQSVQSVFTGLAQSVDASLKSSLAQSGRLAGESLQPVLSAALDDITLQAQATQSQVRSATEQQLQALTATASALLADQSRQDVARLEIWKQQFESLSGTLLDHWARAGEQAVVRQDEIRLAIQDTGRAMAEDSRATAQQMLHQMQALLGETEALVQTRIQSEQTWLAAQREQMTALVAQLRTELAGLRDEEALRGQAAVDRMAGLESTVAQHLAELGAALEQPMTRLIQTAAQAPQAAAEVIAQLRREISHATERDNSLLEERSRLIEQLTALLAGLESASATQQGAVQSLVQASTDLLQQASAGFADKVRHESDKLTVLAAQLTGSSSEVASLGEAFSLAVELFRESNDKLIDNLMRIEESLATTSTRSDEQLAYYVAQAKEIIDLSMLSQKEIFEELRRLGSSKTAVVEEAV